MNNVELFFCQIGRNEEFDAIPSQLLRKVSIVISGHFNSLA